MPNRSRRGATDALERAARYVKIENVYWPDFRPQSPAPKPEITKKKRRRRAPGTTALARAVERIEKRLDAALSTGLQSHERILRGQERIIETLTKELRALKRGARRAGVWLVTLATGPLAVKLAAAVIVAAQVASLGAVVAGQVQESLGDAHSLTIEEAFTGGDPTVEDSGTYLDDDPTTSLVLDPSKATPA